MKNSKYAFLLLLTLVFSGCEKGEAEKSSPVASKNKVRFRPEPHSAYDLLVLWNEKLSPKSEETK